MQKMKKTIEGSGTDLFICFTSRPSSSSSAVSASSAAMRVPSSKSLMSPNRSSSSNPSIPSLSSSLSRRLRSSGSLKGAQSPMFPAAGVAAGRKKGCSFEAAEPSSPKVTCIGQVRVKSKKKKMKNSVSRSRSGRSGPEASFRRSQDSSRTKAVSICDAFNCFVPCCSSETATKREKRGRSSPSCGAVFARWLMAIQEDEEVEVEEKGREFVRELIVREREVGIQVFEKKEAEVVVVEEEEEVVAVEEEEKGRVSVCVPPRNALLLMRCRSDPVRMAELATRFWDSPAMRVKSDEEEEEEEVRNEVEKIVETDKAITEEEEEGGGEVGEAIVEEVEKEVVVDEEKIIVAEEEAEEEVEKEILSEVISAEPPPEEVEKMAESMATDESKEEETIDVQSGEEVEIVLRRSISCSAPKSNDLSKVKRRSFSYREKKERRRHSFSIEREARRQSFCSEKEARRSSFSVEKESRGRWSFSIEKENLSPKEKAKPIAQSRAQTEEEDIAQSTKEQSAKVVELKITEESNHQAMSKREEAQAQGVEREKKGRELPDCLLLMMYEPKLSMEVSKETWVCSTDFLHWRPNYSQQTNQAPKSNANADGGGDKAEDKCVEKKNVIVENKNVIAITTGNSAIAQQPPSKPAIEQKVLKSSAVGPLQQSPYEHFVLTRCKSEPVKSSARLAPDAWFWKSRHQPIGTAGIGF